ncbi:MAG: galactokinase, partial [Verrucomicrobiota bacterium]
FAISLNREDLPALGHLMRASHDSLRSDFEVSCRELDALVDAAYSIGPEKGMIGSRMTGGGFGGSTVSLVRSESAEEIRGELENFYRENFGRELNCFITTAVDGAAPISPPTPT